MNSILNSYFFLFLFLAFILAFWIFGLIYDLNYLFWWYDVVNHFLGGMLVMCLGIFMSRRFGIEISGNGRVIFLFAGLLGFVVLSGVFWEFTEFVFDRYIIKNGFTLLPGIYEDTLSDLFFDLLGGAAGFLLML